MNDYRTDYRIVEWSSLATLETLLNTMMNDGWRVENHKLGNAGDYSGWTIFAKHIQLKQPLLDRRINVGEVYRILNSIFEPGSDQNRKFDAEIKRVVKLPGDDQD
jgi:hypothetical protein